MAAVSFCHVEMKCPQAMAGKKEKELQLTQSLASGGRGKKLEIPCPKCNDNNFPDMSRRKRGKGESLFLQREVKSNALHEKNKRTFK